MKMRVKGVVSIPFETVVEVDSAGGSGYSQAIEFAENDAENEFPEGVLNNIDVRLVEGPLIYNVYWYGLCSDMDSDIVIFNTSINNTIPDNECDEIEKRLKTLGLETVDRWNAGCERVSFKVKGRVGTDGFTEEQVRFLCGDRQVEDM
jgi:hypothetical protein